VQSFLSDATTFVFAPGATSPTRMFTGLGPDVATVAVDPSGYEYVIGGEGPPAIAVEPRRANGKGRISTTCLRSGPSRPMPPTTTRGRA
jgi:hypothetical protein